ncbi:AraC family transcriptional regulator [Glycomyces albidus]|uniref:Helix-turn-helix domain-containing protein n=1 Tax=Glycomyces albidus TaxID=2656774 RepID=A0A6L5GBL9_9ACTN|nr:AraC family transcriptional regulator [Glycomyces albidus]MQM27079.1 helix-turn-helix domain-containing protein [Glycomyces albidus]
MHALRETKGSLALASGSRVHTARYAHEEAVHPHTHGFVELVAVVDGTAVHCSRAGRTPLAVGDLVLLRPGLWHSYEECAGLVLYNLCFNPELLQGELAWTRDDRLLGGLLRSAAGEARGRLDAGALAECTAHLDALAALGSPPPATHRADLVGRLALVLGIAARALAPAAGTGPGAHPAALAAARLLEDRPERRWTLERLGAELHLSPGYLARRFKAAFGLPPLAYLARHRIETAAGLLLHTDLPVGRIARDVGWADPNLFARRFRERIGMSPTAYRKTFAHRTAHDPATASPERDGSRQDG